MLGGRGSGKVGGQDQGNTSNLDEREGGDKEIEQAVKSWAQSKSTEKLKKL